MVWDDIIFLSKLRKNASWGELGILFICLVSLWWYALIQSWEEEICISLKIVFFSYICTWGLVFQCWNKAEQIFYDEYIILH